MDASRKAAEAEEEEGACCSVPVTPRKAKKEAAALAGKIFTPEKPAAAEAEDEASYSVDLTPRKAKKEAAALADQIFTPEKPAPKPAAAAADLVWTPDKAERRRPTRRAASRGGVAFSVKGVRRAALELRRAGPAEAAEKDELESVERELGVGAGAGRSPVKRKPEVKLPESYEILCEFFNCFESSTRLLRMKGSKATFPNICASIQNLSERRFTYGHLAQLKYIMPEAIVINKILLRDERTCCMKPDLQVNLLVDAIGGGATQKGETQYSALRRIFRQRLVDFFRNHPEGDVIPEHELPHPFNQTKASVPQIIRKVVPEAAPAAAAPCPTERQPVAMSHMPHSFKRMFSKKSSTCYATAITTSPLPKVEPVAPSPFSRKSLLDSPVCSSFSIGHVAQAQEQGVKDVELKYGMSEGTPAKFSSTPVRLMAATPDLHTPKRPISAIGWDTPPLKMAKRSARTKLFMTPTKDASGVELARTKLFMTPTKDESSVDEESQSTSTSAIDGDDELLSFLPKSLLQSVKEKEKRALEERETGFVDHIQRQKLIASLPGTFDIILLIYQSNERSVMTKQELIHKIIASNPKIADRGEVEDQLRLLVEFVPDWISEKTARTGDILVCVDTALSQAEIRQRLYPAK